VWSSNPYITQSGLRAGLYAFRTFQKSEADFDPKGISACGIQDLVRLPSGMFGKAWGLTMLSEEETGITDKKKMKKGGEQERFAVSINLLS
jgi:hypothetical protein